MITKTSNALCRFRLSDTDSETTICIALAQPWYRRHDLVSGRRSFRAALNSSTGETKHFGNEASARTRLKEEACSATLPRGTNRMSSATRNRARAHARKIHADYLSVFARIQLDESDGMIPQPSISDNCASRDI